MAQMNFNFDLTWHEWAIQQQHKMDKAQKNQDWKLWAKIGNEKW